MFKRGLTWEAGLTALKVVSLPRSLPGTYQEMVKGASRERGE